MKAPTVENNDIYAVTQLKSGDTLKLNAAAANSTAVDATVLFVVGYYENDMLQYVQTADTNIASGAVSVDGAEIAVGDLAGIEEIKVFMWDFTNSMQPYCKEIVCEDYLTTFMLEGQGNHHTQGITVDKENGYMYQSIQQDIKKYDIETGEVVASILGFGEIFGSTETNHMPNCAKYLLDLTKAPTEQKLDGSPNNIDKILQFGDYGAVDAATGMKGTYETEGAHGMTYLGEGYYYMTTTNYNGNMDTPVQLYKFLKKRRRI